MARDAGANKVYMASAAPAVRFPNVYGIDMPAVEELIAHGRTDEEVGELIGADWMIYQNLEDLIDAVRKGNPAITEFDCSCFDGHYVTNNISKDYLEQVKANRNDSAKQKTEERQTDVGMELHNNV
jgi:amidophosphoribosyltransferase